MWRDSPDTIDKWDALIDDNVDAKLMGHDHHMVGDFKGKAAWKEGNRSRFTSLYDAKSPPKTEFVNVIGGGDSPWACVELKTTGRGVSGR